ncbi:MAG TPA: hypothetical protein VND45_16185 [Thermoanaerobaculia bacterium]|jgi:hypothetical protein|nr:hypothetical protein [Thermoanaerobaculia bacterium]
MATIYYNDLGFDWNAEKPHTDKFYFLMWGAWKATTAGDVTGTPSYLTDIRPGDELRFNIYDLTEYLDVAGPSSVTHAPELPAQWIVVHIANTTIPAGTEPFSLEWQSLNHGATITRMSPPEQASPALSPLPVPAWTINVATVTVQNLIQRPARFRLTFYLDVKVGGETRSFRHDPEMIVTPGG